MPGGDRASWGDVVAVALVLVDVAFEVVVGLTLVRVSSALWLPVAGTVPDNEIQGQGLLQALTPL